MSLMNQVDFLYLKSCPHKLTAESRPGYGGNKFMLKTHTMLRKREGENTPENNEQSNFQPKYQ